MKLEYDVERQQNSFKTEKDYKDYQIERRIHINMIDSMNEDLLKNDSITNKNIQGLKIAVFGTQGSGKTECSKHVIRTSFKAPLVLTPHIHDFENEKCNLIITNNETDMDDLICDAVKLAKAGKIDVIVIDEADMWFRSGQNLKPNAVDLFSNHRHYPEGKGVSVMLISRRPQDIPTIYVESCQFILIYKLEGDNVQKKFNGIKKGFGDLITREEFKYKTYLYFLKEIGEEPVLCSPIPYKEKKTKKAVLL